MPKYNVRNISFIGALLLAPIQTALVGIVVGLPTENVIAYAALFAPFLGGLQYLIFGGIALWIYLHIAPPKPIACAVLLFAVNLGVCCAGILLGAILPRAFPREFFEICLHFGSVFAPLWGFVFALLFIGFGGSQPFRHRAEQT